MLQSVVQPLVRRVTDKGSKTLIQRAIASLRARGTDAHLWLPGIGTLNGLQTGNYLESTGNSVATVNNPAGLVLDALGTVGVSRVVNGDFATDTVWVKGPQTTISGGKATIASTGAASGLAQNSILTPSSTYQITFNATVRSGTGKLENSVGATHLTIDATRAYSCVLSGASNLVFNRISACDIDIDNVEAREVTGIHASQGTTNAKPILEQTGSKYAWRFDGSNDSLALGSVPFQQSDDHYVCAAFSLGAVGVQQTVFMASNTADGNPFIRVISTSTNQLQFQWRDNAGTLVSLAGTLGAVTVGAKFVVTMANIGGVRSAWINGIALLNSSTVLGATTLNTANIGVDVRTTSTGYLNGKIYYLNPVKGTLTESERKQVEALAANAAGISF